MYEIIAISSIITILSILAYMAYLTIYTMGPQLRRAYRHAEEQTAKMWPEDRYGDNLESFNGGNNETL